MSVRAEERDVRRRIRREGEGGWEGTEPKDLLIKINPRKLY
jgi:hypothetical protein